MYVNNKFKNSVFTTLFSNEKVLIELYNALEGSNYNLSTPVEITTLSDVLYMGKLNDISFTIDNKLVVLIEHQSTINPNMPLRILLYIARIYEKLVKVKSLYKEKLIKIPCPEFFVLYNGNTDFPDEKILNLSDAFEKIPGFEGVELELKVKVLNINYEHNQKIVEQSRELLGYTIFIGKVKEFLVIMSKDKAFKKAIKYCIENDILKDFLEKNATEVINMLTEEFNLDMAKEVWQEEAWEDGMERGREEGMERVLKLVRKGFSAEKIEQLLTSNKQRK
jgi:predicted transposase/invertase (TIGR01784 family)